LEVLPYVANIPKVLSLLCGIREIFYGSFSLPLSTAVINGPPQRTMASSQQRERTRRWSAFLRGEGMKKWAACGLRLNKGHSFIFLRTEV